MQIKGPNVPKDALAGGGDLPDTAGLDTLGKIANKAGEKVSSLCAQIILFVCHDKSVKLASGGRV